MSVTVINSFEVPAGREGEFLELWKKVNAYMQRKPGYLGNKLHRAITPDAPFQFVHVAQWASMAHFQICLRITETLRHIYEKVRTSLSRQA